MTGAVVLPLVTVLVPCRNEGRFITPCLSSILHNGYPLDRLELLVIDGASTDDTVAQVRALASVYSCVRLIHNSRRVTPVSLNLGIAASRGSRILWMSAHNTYAPGYIRECVEAGERYGADNVGGGIETVARDHNIMAPFVIAALTHRFGVGGSAFRLVSDEPQWVDTVFGGCYRREVFDQVGVFNEALTRGQDMEFNLRLKRAGLRTLLLPSVRSVYHARSRFVEFLRHNWVNGVWAVLPFRHAQHAPVSLRHLVPMAFVGSVLVAVLLALTVPGGAGVLRVLIGSYLAAAFVAGVDVAARRRRLVHVLVVPWVFLSLHLSYGAGSWWGAARLVVGWFKDRLTSLRAGGR